MLSCISRSSLRLYSLKNVTLLSILLSVPASKDISDSDFNRLFDGVSAESANDKRRTDKNDFGISGIEPDTW